MTFRQERSEMVAERLCDIWEENYVKNRPYMMDPDQDFETFKAKLGSRCRNEGPAVVVGAGPSWKKNIDSLGQSLYVIVACDKMVPRLKERGIIPEIVVALNAEHTDVASWLEPIREERDVTLVVPAGVNPEAIEGWMGHIQWINAMVPTGLHKRIERETHLSPMVIGSNAGTFGYVIASAIGYNPIAYTGLDFSFLTRQEVMRKHIIAYRRVEHGTQIGGYPPDSIMSCKVDEPDLIPIYANQYNLVEMTDINDEVRWLDLGWWDMSCAFQEHVKQASEWFGIKTYNCTEGGINQSEYSRQMALKDFNTMLKGEVE